MPLSKPKSKSKDRSLFRTNNKNFTSTMYCKKETFPCHVNMGHFSLQALFINALTTENLSVNNIFKLTYTPRPRNLCTKCQYYINN